MSNKTTKTRKSALLRLAEFATRRGRNLESGNRAGAGDRGEVSSHGQLQRKSELSEAREVPAIVDFVLASPGESLDSAARNYFEPRFGQDFSRVRIHADSQAAESASAVGARAYTAGEDVVFSPGRYQPATTEGRHLLAHELAHVVQQKNSAPRMATANEGLVSQPQDASEIAADNAADLIMTHPGHRLDTGPLRGASASIQRTVDDPKRFQEVHGAIFPTGNQAPGGGTLLNWENPDPAKSIVGTAETLFKQAQAAFKKYFQQNPGATGGTIPVKTTEADLDKDAVDVNQALRQRFPFISAPVSEPQIKAAVNVMSAKLTSDPDYLRKWLANRLPKFSDVEKYKIDEADPRLTALFDRLLADPDVGPDLKIQASRQGGFQRGEGTKREIFIHSGADPKKRQRTLFHELTHFYAHPTYREWVATTTNERWYNEGFTEFLARLAMPPDLVSTDYQDRVDSINTQVAAHVPVDDIARAFFLGEIWRIETRSKISRRETGAQLGLKETATEKEEIEASRTGPGINQTVEKGKRYRFMNLGFDRTQPKPEHVTFFREVKTAELDPAPSLGVRFEGHASTAGTLAYNLSLSLGRALAFYQMARSEHITGDRLVDAAQPPHFGETKPTAEEEDPLTRAFNRRVEMELLPTTKKKP